MAKLEDMGELISTDLLIIGGGIAGLATAIRAKEVSPEINVLLVDKQTIGWGGKANKGAGVLWVLTPENDLDEFAEYHVRNLGDYLNDQDLLYSMARDTYRVLEQLSEWGVKVQKDAEGKIATIKALSPKWSWAAADLDMMSPLRARARKLGTKMMDKIQVVELLKHGDRVIGAVGFNLLDGRFYIFNAKAAILANGDCNFGVTRMWADGCGDGIAAAYRAGAEMRNAEFGNFSDLSAPFGYNLLYNAAGEHISPKYIKKPEPDIPISIILGMEKEVLEGRGPIFIDMEAYMKAMAGHGLMKWDRPHFKARFGWEIAKMVKYQPQPTSPKREVTLNFIGEFSPVKVDHEMKTTLPGLWAIGDISWSGSAWGGAVHPPLGVRGSGLMNATLAAIRGAPSAVQYISQASIPKIDVAEMKRLKDAIFAPMARKKGYLPTEAIRAIQEVVVPVKYNIRRSKDRLEEALSKVANVQEKLSELYAEDGHGLGKCNEAKCMVLCAEMGFRAALMRTESRGWHYREDYPNRDDKNWLKWVIVKQEGGKMILFTEPVPIDKYKIKP